jgi:hypothetical protein
MSEFLKDVFSELNASSIISESFFYVKGASRRAFRTAWTQTKGNDGAITESSIAPQDDAYSVTA